MNWWRRLWCTHLWAHEYSNRAGEHWICCRCLKTIVRDERWFPVNPVD